LVEKKNREELLVNLHIVDERGYPLEVTEEEYHEILKYATPKENTLGGKTKWSEKVFEIAYIYLGINIFAGIIFCFILLDNYATEDYASFPIIIAIVDCINFPLIMGIGK